MRDVIRLSLAAFGTVTVFATAYPALADTVEERRAKGAAVVSKLNNGVPQNNLENMRREFPFLAEATEAYDGSCRLSPPHRHAPWPSHLRRSRYSSGQVARRTLYSSTVNLENTLGGPSLARRCWQDMQLTNSTIWNHHGALQNRL